MKKVKAGDLIGGHRLRTIESRPVLIPDPKRFVHLQFRRFAGCPFCSVHLGTLQKRHNEIAKARIREVLVFRSTVEALQSHHADTPFAIIADPEELLYVEFGVGSGANALLAPRALMAVVPNVFRMLPKFPGFPPWGKGVLGLPAEFLIAMGGRVVACKYGMHAEDHWSVDELLVLVRRYVASH